MTLHRHRSPNVVFTRIMGLFWILFPVCFLITAWYDLLTGSPTAMPAGDLVGVSVGLVFGLVAGVTISNSFPDIMVYDDGLGVKFCFKWLFVPWDDIIAVKTSLASLSGRIYIVQVRKLTVVHRLVSLCQALSLQPGFLVSPRIDGYHQLLRVIREHTGGTQATTSAPPQ